MKDNFASSMKKVLVHEGGKVDDKRDPGGRTNQGVTQKTFNGWLAARSKKPRDVYTMTAAERDAIYKVQYWDAVKGDKLPDGVDYVVFDGAVNSGVSQSIKWLQRALGVVADGSIGQLTLAAVDAHPNPAELIDAICDRRMAFLRALKTWPTFGKGWTNRVESVRKAGKAMYLGGAVGKPVHFAGGNAKALLEDAKKAPKTVVSDASAGGGAGVTGGITWVQSQLEPYQELLPFLGRVVAVVVILGVVVTIGGGAYSWWARRRAAELKDALDTGVPAQSPAPDAVQP